MGLAEGQGAAAGSQASYPLVAAGTAAIQFHNTLGGWDGRAPERAFPICAARIIPLRSQYPRKGDGHDCRNDEVREEELGHSRRNP